MTLIVASSRKAVILSLLTCLGYVSKPYSCSVARRHRLMLFHHGECEPSYGCANPVAGEGCKSGCQEEGCGLRSSRHCLLPVVLFGVHPVAATRRAPKRPLGREPTGRFQVEFLAAIWGTASAAYAENTAHRVETGHVLLSQRRAGSGITSSVCVPDSIYEYSKSRDCAPR